MRRCAALLAILLSACGPRPATPSVALDDRSDGFASVADKAFWIEKTAKALRNGQGIGLDDDMGELMALSRDEIVARFLADWRFGDTVVAFNLYFLSRGINAVRAGPRSRELGDAVWQHPQAVAAAQAAMTDGDYWQLFDPETRILAGPMRNPFFGPQDPPDDVISPTDPGAEPMSPARREAMRQRHFSDIQRRIEQSIVALRLMPGSGCAIAKPMNDFIAAKLRQSGYPRAVVLAVTELWLPKLYMFIDAVSGSTFCAGAPPGPVIIARAEAISRALPQISGLAATLGESSQDIVAVADLRPVDLVVEDLPPLKMTALSQAGFWLRLINSSTNYNRKRAAYILKTYLCDDLTPIATAPGDDHGGGRHASDPACQSCHYKLDPLAGLFRYHGVGGIDFKGASGFFFDDQTLLDGAGYDEYLRTWRRSPREYRVGHYVAPGTPHPQWQGQELDDLWKFLRQAPEPKQCVVRRLAEYFLGPEQVYDGAWLEEISTDLRADGATGAALRGVIRQLVLSNTFSERDPESGRCYDYATGVDPSARPPCAVASITEKRCAQCHSSSGEGLNVTDWVDTGGGAMAFHYVRGGRQLPAQEVFQSVLDRIAATDPGRRMPRGGPIPEVERQTLYHWLEEQLGVE